jgi:hypothetical protein
MNWSAAPMPAWADPPIPTGTLSYGGERPELVRRPGRTMTIDVNHQTEPIFDADLRED